MITIFRLQLRNFILSGTILQNYQWKEAINLANEYQKLASSILENVGGKANIDKLTYCVTRLRFKLKDESKIDVTKLKETEGIVTVVKTDAQFQIVIGKHVVEVYEEICKVANLKKEAPVEVDGTPQKQGFFKNLTKKLFQ